MNIINLSLSEGVFPDRFKQTLVTSLLNIIRSYWIDLKSGLDLMALNWITWSATANIISSWSKSHPPSPTSLN